MGVKVGRIKRSVYIVILGRSTFLAGNEIFEESVSNNIFLMILGCPFSENILDVERPNMARAPLRRRGQKMRYFRSKTSFRSRKITAALKIENPTLNRAQSADGYLQWEAQMCPCLRPFLAGLYAFFRKQERRRAKLAGNSRLRTKNLGYS